jgi:hypothetical protein
MNKITDFFSSPMPKKKKSDDTEETINTSESIVAVLASSFFSAKEQIANTWPSCWSLEQKNDFCQKKVWLFIQKTEKLVVVPAVEFELLESRQKWA